MPKPKQHAAGDIVEGRHSVTGEPKETGQRLLTAHTIDLGLVPLHVYTKHCVVTS